MDMNLEFTSCPLCKSENSRSAYSSFDRYKVVRCNTCKLYYLSPRLKELNMLSLYGDDSYFEGEDEGYTSYSDQEISLRATFRRLILNLVSHHLVGGKLLEVGCGYGYFLDEAKSFFEYRAGTDFSLKAVCEAQKYCQLIYHGGIDAVPVQEKFDLIIAAHVIEHVYHPHDFLEQIVQHLYPGGSVVIATPDMGSFWRYLMGHNWPSFKLPEHILYFDKSSLSKLMKERGISNIKTLPYPHAFPLPLVTNKLGIKVPAKFNKFKLWMPATTLALYGKYDG